MVLVHNEKSILLIGATGKTGMAIARKLSTLSNVRLHAMARSPEKLDSVRYMFKSVTKGNARNAGDIEHALSETGATCVIISVGNGEDTSRDDIRTANAVATTSVLEKSEFSHVRVMAVSSIGAGPTKMNIGFGVGKLLAFHLRHVLADHTGQEKAFAALGTERVTIVRATALTDDAPAGKLVTFGDDARCPTIKTDRADLAGWIANEIGGTAVLPHGGAVNVTGSPSKK